MSRIARLVSAGMKRLLRSWGTILFVALSFFIVTPARADWTVTVTTVDGKIIAIESPICPDSASGSPRTPEK